MINYKGVGVALITPFSNDGEVDYVAVTKLINHVIENEVDYLVVFGTTGEPATLTETEKERLLSHIEAINNGRVPIVLGIGGNNTAKVISGIKNASLNGISAILSVVPYYNKPTQEGIYQHFATIAKNSPLPIILYNVPGRTGVNMNAQTTIRLAKDFKNIVAIKEASGNLGQVAYILRDRPQNFAVISGDDNLTLPLIALGGDGVISVSANVFTQKFCKMVHAAIENNLETAQKLNLELHEATDLLFVDGNPAGAKAALDIKGIVKNNLRLPLVKVGETTYANLKAQIEKYNL